MSRPDLSGATIGGHFDLKSRLGSGHFGDVYFCENTLLGHESALKVIPVKASNPAGPELEAKLLNLSNHAHIVKVRSATHWQDAAGADFLLIEMEYVPGGSLEDAIRREVSLGELTSVMKNVLFALDHAHPEVIHRDVKPANILLGGGGKLSDFGIAMLSSTGATASNYLYNLNLAPECLPPTKTFNVSTDVFAAGLAFQRGLNLITDWRETLRKIPGLRSKMADGTLVKTLGFHVRVPTRLRKIVSTACAKDPAKRYPTAAAFRDALESTKILRDWRRANPDTWQCEYNGLSEELSISVNRGRNRIEYLRNGRRKTAFSKAIIGRAQAERYVYEIIARTTLAP